jgi:hypothetical protein
MRDLPEIVASYEFIERHLVALQLAAQAGSAEEAKIATRRVINDQAYFVLCWGQLEAAIDDKCRDAIRRRKNNPDWTKRRAWDLYNPDDSRLSGLAFYDRVGLVTDRAAGAGSAWAKIMRYYQMRNEIAHGRLSRTTIDVAAAAQEFYQLSSQLHA